MCVTLEKTLIKIGPRYRSKRFKTESKWISSQNESDDRLSPRVTSLYKAKTNRRRNDFIWINDRKISSDLKFRQKNPFFVDLDCQKDSFSDHFHCCTSLNNEENERKKVQRFSLFYFDDQIWFTKNDGRHDPHVFRSS